jgi:hypothetical protein
MHVNGKIKPGETIPGMEGGERWRGEFNYDTL